MAILGEYKNGNYTVTIHDNGTKIRENDLDFFESEFPENMDVKITNYCDMNCPYCHENSTESGKHADLLSDKMIRLLDSLSPHTEMAIGGGNPLDHPDLTQFLLELRKRDIIPNLTINQKHFMEKYLYITTLVEKKFIFGVGISLTDASEEFIKKAYSLDNAVIHVINGIVTEKQIKKLASRKLKILILGYKNFGRGKEYMMHNQTILKDILDNNPMNLFKSFKVVSFDNLALKQLGIEEIIGGKMWNRLYMGDDGDFTMYLDLVKEEFGMNSTSKVRYPLKDNVVDMFKVVKENKDE